MYSTPKEKWLTDPPDGEKMTDEEKIEFREWFQSLSEKDKQKVSDKQFAAYMAKHPASDEVKIFDGVFTPKEAERLIRRIRLSRQFIFYLEDGQNLWSYTKEEVINEIRKRVRG